MAMDEMRDEGDVLARATGALRGVVVPPMPEGLLGLKEPVARTRRGRWLHIKRCRIARRAPQMPSSRRARSAS